jgi:hypothetical protein
MTVISLCGLPFHKRGKATEIYFYPQTYFKYNNQIQIICNVTLTCEKNGKLFLYYMLDKAQVNTEQEILHQFEYTM